MELCTIRQEDCPRMLEMLTHPLVKKTYMLPDFPTPEDAAPLFRRLLELSQQQDRFVRGIRDGDTLVGFLNDVQTNGTGIELGYVIHPDSWNRGCATAALKLAMADLAQKGFREVITGAFEENPASLRVMEKAGMIRSGEEEFIEYRGTQHRCIYCTKAI